jgi:hypothetical protein
LPPGKHTLARAAATKIKKGAEKKSDSGDLRDSHLPDEGVYE